MNETHQGQIQTQNFYQSAIPYTIIYIAFSGQFGGAFPVCKEPSLLLYEHFLPSHEFSVVPRGLRPELLPCDLFSSWPRTAPFASWHKWAWKPHGMVDSALGGHVLPLLDHVRLGWQADVDPM